MLVAHQSQRDVGRGISRPMLALKNSIHEPNGQAQYICSSFASFLFYFLIFNFLIYEAMTNHAMYFQYSN